MFKNMFIFGGIFWLLTTALLVHRLASSNYCIEALTKTPGTHTRYTEPNEWARWNMTMDVQPEQHYTRQRIAATSGGNEDTWTGVDSAFDIKVTERPPQITGEHNRTPTTHIVFLKVHKAGSTTLQSIFLRFGYTRNLTFILNKIKYANYFSNEKQRHNSILPPPNGSHYDILCNHAVFDYDIISKLLPKDTVYLAVVRNPLSQFISAFYYYRSVYKKYYLTRIPGDAIQNLILHPELYETHTFSHTWNSMSQDFGFTMEHIRNKTARWQYIEHLDKTFHLVLIAEHMEESVVLMKRLLQWSMKDVIYITKNVNGQRISVNASTMETFAERNALDYLVYEYFYAKFKTQLADASDDFYDEVNHFKKSLKMITRWCHQESSGTLKIPQSNWDDEFFLSNGDCELMKLSEFPFLHKLRENALHKLISQSR